MKSTWSSWRLLRHACGKGSCLLACRVCMSLLPQPSCLSQISVGDITSEAERERTHQMIQYPGRYGRKPGVLGTNGTKRMESRPAPGALSAMDGTLAACSSPSSTDH